MPPEIAIKTRFAPSPTGFLHVGGARTALFAWAYAKHCGGKFVLRIEDTDQARSTQEAIDAILQGMAWLDLPWDEGPYYQMQRLDRYHEVAEQLIQEGKAYRCTCSLERLEKMREEQKALKQKSKYDGHCREKQLPATETPSVVRLKNALAGTVHFHDLIYGDITVANEELDDFVMLRSDGVPTYNFSVVIDDIDMAITHVIRGDDHINNTPKQLNLYAAMKVTPPFYAHVPMILGPDGKKLSKRHGAASVLEFELDGILPEALVNYLIRLGWAHGDQEIFSREDILRDFDLKAIHKSPATFDREKLLWLNQHYLKTLDPARIAKRLEKVFQRFNIPYQNGPDLETLVLVQAERCRTLNEIVENSRYFYEDFKEYDKKAERQQLIKEHLPQLQLLYEKLNALKEWKKESLHHVIQAVAAELNIGMGKVAMPLRVAVTGNSISPSVDTTLKLLGKERVISRLNRAITFIQNQK
ncbi:MAG TPA: glutamate--tRNA ligase [Coxiellaceae bacterium]|nr:glutamate--tRNA ligase [Coxiellaceae bacterium]